MPEYESSESDVDESISSATQNLDNNTVTQDQADKQRRPMTTRHPMTITTSRLARHHGRSTHQSPSKPDPKIPTPRRKKIFLNNTIRTKNMQTIATQSLTPRSPNTFLDTALSMERSQNIIQQVTTTPSLIKTAIRK